MAADEGNTSGAFSIDHELEKQLEACKGEVAQGTVTLVTSDGHAYANRWPWPVRIALNQCPAGTSSRDRLPSCPSSSRTRSRWIRAHTRYYGGAAVRFQLLTHALQLTLKHVDEVVIRPVIVWMCHHSSNPSRAISRPLRSANIAEIVGLWDANFLDSMPLELTFKVSPSLHG